MVTTAVKHGLSFHKHYLDLNKFESTDNLGSVGSEWQRLDPGWFQGETGVSVREQTMAEGRMSTGNNDEMDLESSSDLSIDNYTFDQHIDAGSQSIRSSQRHNTEILSQVRTLEGQVLSKDNAGTDIAGFVRIQTRPTSDANAYFKNVLPVPALDCYAGIPPPSTKVGKFVKHPRFCSFERKLQSFYQHGWPLRQPCPASLARAGFFYRGTFNLENGHAVTDQVYCYKCGESIRQWKEDDDPLMEHHRIHPHCFKETWITG